MIYLIVFTDYAGGYEIMAAYFSAVQAEKDLKEWRERIPRSEGRLEIIHKQVEPVK